MRFIILFLVLMSLLISVPVVAGERDFCKDPVVVAFTQAAGKACNQMEAVVSADLLMKITEAQIRGVMNAAALNKLVGQTRAALVKANGNTEVISALQSRLAKLEKAIGDACLQQGTDVEVQKLCLTIRRDMIADTHALDVYQGIRLGVSTTPTKRKMIEFPNGQKVVEENLVLQQSDGGSSQPCVNLTRLAGSAEGDTIYTKIECPDLPIVPIGGQLMANLVDAPKKISSGWSNEAKVLAISGSTVFAGIAGGLVGFATGHGGYTDEAGGVHDATYGKNAAFGAGIGAGSVLAIGVAVLVINEICD